MREAKKDSINFSSQHAAIAIYLVNAIYTQSYFLLLISSFTNSYLLYQYNKHEKFIKMSKGIDQVYETLVLPCRTSLFL